MVLVDLSLSLSMAEVRFQWTGGQIIVKRPPWSQEDLPKPIRLPYPVPWQAMS